MARLEWAASSEIRRWEVAAASECKVTVMVNKRMCQQQSAFDLLWYRMSAAEQRAKQKKMDDEYAACKEDVKGKPYEVAKLVNTITPQLGTHLSDREVQALIDQGTCVEVRPPGTFW